MVHQLEGTATSTHLGVKIMLPGIPESTSKRRQNFRVREDVEDKVYQLLNWEGERAIKLAKTVPWFAVIPFTVTVRNALGRGNFVILVVEDRDDQGGSGNIVW